MQKADKVVGCRNTLKSVGSGGSEALSKGVGMASRLIGNRRNADAGNGVAHMSRQGSLGADQDLGEAGVDGPGGMDVQHDMEEAMADQNGMPGTKIWG